MWLRLELNIVQPGTFWIDDLQIVKVNDKAATRDGKTQRKLESKYSGQFLEEYNQVVKLGRDQLSDDERKTFFAEYPNREVDWSGELSRGAMEMFANLPDSLHDELRKTGYLKWRFSDITAAQQNIFEQGFYLFVRRPGWKPELIKTSEVGFAIVPLATSTVVSAYVLYPNDLSEMWTTVVGVRDADNDHRAAHLSRLPTLRAKPLTQLSPQSGAAIAFPPMLAPPPPSAVALFDRWVGEWDATFEVKPNAQSPHDRNTRGTMTTRKVLDDRCLLTHSANESDPTQWLWFLTHDANFAVYRIWIFGNGGEAFERRGQWDAASQMLTLQLVPPSPGVTGQSTDRFIGNDRIESTLFVKSANGQVTRENRWSAKKRTPQPERLPEIPSASDHAPLPEELSLLNKFAGEWTILAKSKPSIWLPNGDEETLTEKVAWILGGRFLMARTFNEEDELTSIWLATYEPSEKSNRFWFFNADGSSGQWRVTWDAASRGFHWRSIDMPPGWIGTGFNRWIDDDTFDNQALIKDEQGRVLLDSTQDKRRKM